MQVVYEAVNWVDAHLMKGALESEGILVYLRGEFLTGAMGELPASGMLALLVNEEDVERALALIKAMDTSAPLPGANDSDDFLIA